MSQKSRTIVNTNELCNRSDSVYVAPCIVGKGSMKTYIMVKSIFNIHVHMYIHIDLVCF